MRIRKGDEWKMAFNCLLGCYQFWVMPFELHGAPAIFIKLINEVLHEHLYKRVLVYTDDIFIYIVIMKEHVKLVRVILEKF